MVDCKRNEERENDTLAVKKGERGVSKENNIAEKGIGL